MTSRTTKIDFLAERMTQLADAFREFCDTVPGLRVDVVGYMAGSDALVHPVAGFEVRLQRDSGAGVSLYISASYAELTSWTGKSAELKTGRAVRERFNVHFGEEFEWGGSAFEYADELANGLLGYMQFNLDAISAR
ncbi:MAG TPA: hypothetical protein VFO52_09660 [Longimicrobiales bacterium]|nr:hypothetical protein [Longimicrobiales bacterium]